MSNHGYVGTLTELHCDTKFYKVYYLHNPETRDERVLYNWGKIYTSNGGDGQFKVELDVSDRWDKINSKLKRGYSYVKNQEPVTVEGWLLRQAGWSAPTPVALKGLELFVSDTDNLIAALSSYRLRPEMVERFAGLREQLEQIQSQVADAEGRMEILTAIITAKFEEES